MMRRKRNEKDPLDLIFPLIALAVILFVLIPKFFPFVVTIVFWIVGGAVLALVVLCICRLGFGLRPTSRLQPSPLFSQPVDPVTQTTQPVTQDILQQLRTIDWFQFEKIVAWVYRKRGFSVTRRGGANPDGGIDLIIEKSGQQTAVQCKQWKTWNVGVKTVREFLGSLTDAGISNGVIITLCGCTGEAKQLADKHHIEIIDETGLAQMLEQTKARFEPEAQEILLNARKFCPKCDSELVKRTANKGGNAGKTFWGCSTYPRCRFTLRIN